MPKLMRSVSGIRGIVGDPLTPTLVLEYLNAFLQIVKAKKVVIGRDTRGTGPMLEEIISQGCIAAGVEVEVVGMATTPTVEMMVTKQKAGGGIIITASHNPIEWNALKFLNKEGEFLDETAIQKLFAFVDQKNFKWASYKHIKTIGKVGGSDSHHIDSILKLPCITPPLIRKQNFKVAYDAVNGAGCHIIPELLKQLGCTVFPINITPDGIFPHNPEPTPENLKQLSDEVLKHKCDVGFATDPDSDRCAIVSEKGKSIGEEYTLVFASDLILSQTKGPVTINLSTSRMIEDLGEKYGVKVHRAKVGEINVSMVMKKNASVIGGEGNGGVILPNLHYGRDGVLAVAMTLQYLVEKSQSISACVEEIPKYFIEKQKIDIGSKDLSNIFGRLLAKFDDIHIDQQDGLRFEWEKSWLHVRASNTEPVIRVIAEAPTQKEALDLCNLIVEEI